MATAFLIGSPEPLARRYDVALLDLDGVVYLGAQAIDGVPQALAAVRDAGMRLAFVTNNAARPAHVVAERLTKLGVPARTDEVVTSSQAAARHLAESLPAGARVLVVGTTGLDEALTEAGLHPVHSADDDPVAVVQGYSPELSWSQLAEGAVAIERGLPWVATNLDPTVPSPRGPLPGNGSLVAALRHATGATPVSTGKPDPAMHRESLLRSGARRPLVVGDRLDTDIEGATAVGCASLLVLSGVTTARILLDAADGLRPSFIGQDAAALTRAHPAVSMADGVAHCGRWQARDDSGDSVLTSGGAPEGAGPDDDGLDGLRALCELHWSLAGTDEHADARGVRGGDDDAAALLATLDLA